MSEVPDHTAVRVALWRALHVEIDPPPHVLEDLVGLELAAPEDGWRARRDMDPRFTARPRASIVARARFVEDLVEHEAARGVDQYVILGAGLDTFAQRRPDLGDRLTIFEIDRPETQAWKRRRLEETGRGVPDRLKLVPVDFEAGASWREAIGAAGFDAGRPAVVAAAGLFMYLTRAAVLDLLRQVASLAPGSTLVATFQPPTDALDEEDRRLREISERGAAAAGTPFLSYFPPEEILALAREAGFRDARHVSAAEQNALYFSGRADGLRTSDGEQILVAGA